MIFFRHCSLSLFLSFSFFLFFFFLLLSLYRVDEAKKIDEIERGEGHSEGHTGFLTDCKKELITKRRFRPSEIVYSLSIPTSTSFLSTTSTSSASTSTSSSSSIGKKDGYVERFITVAEPNTVLTDAYLTEYHHLPSSSPRFSLPFHYFPLCLSHFPFKDILKRGPLKRICFLDGFAPPFLRFHLTLPSRLHPLPRPPPPLPPLLLLLHHLQHPTRSLSPLPSIP